MITFLLVVGAAALLLMGLFAPFETLGWWAGYYGEKPGEALDEELPPSAPQSDKAHFVVYLTGIGGTSPTEYDPKETLFLERLAAALPDLELVDDVFPYSAINRALTGQRVFSWFWRALYGFKGKLGMISFLINIRNLWQVLVSSDSRFGPLYNYASSQTVLKRLLAHGYRPGSGVPITFIGYSGGGQIASGSAPLLGEALRAPVYVISLAGVMSSNPGLLRLEHLSHLYGSKDGVQRLGALLFPGRWPLAWLSAWNRARKAGLIDKLPLGDMVHTGKNSYLDPEARLADGETHLAKTVAVMTQLIREQASRR